MVIYGGAMMNVLEYTPIAQFAIGKDHRVTYWNRACELLTGYASAEMIGTDRQWEPFYSKSRPVLADLIIDQDFRHFKSLYQGKRASKSEIIPHAWEATDYFENLGECPRHVFFLAAPVFDEKGNIVGAVETLQDITERVIAEMELRSSEQRYRALAENVADGVMLLQDWKIIFANQALSKILGHSNSDDLIGKRLEDLIAGESAETVKKLKEAFLKGRSLENVLQLQGIKSGGNQIWMEAHNSAIFWEGRPAVLTAIRDVTDARLEAIAMQDEAEFLRKENKILKNSIRDHQGFGKIVGKSGVMLEIYDFILKAAETDNVVVIYGESGTGKELVAREIHKMSSRGKGEFVPVNCGAIPEALMEREFFGHKKGAFTGADKDTHGYLDLANGGVLFLDEIGDLSLNMQVKLLRAMEDGSYMPVGSNKVKTSDFRIIAATNKDLREMISNGKMRKDFFYRLHVIPIHLPPLRERKEDIPLLVQHFLQHLGIDGKVATIPKDVLEGFAHHDWPGNVRELQNLLRRYVSVGSLDFIDLEPVRGDQKDSGDPSAIKRKNLPDAVADYERGLIKKSLDENQWHKDRTAVALGISRRTLFRKLKNYELL